MERFIIEYANYRKNNLKANDLMKNEYKAGSIDKIDSALKLKERGLITSDETIKMILHA